MAFVLKPISGGSPINLSGIRTRIGSSQELCDAHIDDSQILPLHCQVFHQDDGFVLQNLTKNRILVNGNPETQTRLNPGDRIQIGKVIYEFTDDTIPFPQASVDEASVSGNALAAITRVRPGAEVEPIVRQTSILPTLDFTLVLNRQKRSNISLSSEKNELLIGRDEGKGSEFIIDDARVSGLHCRLYSEDNVLKIEDLKSTNGVYINGIKISEPTKLINNDLVKLGESFIRILFSGTLEYSLLENGITLNSNKLTEGSPGLKFTLLDRERARGLVNFTVPLTEKVTLGRHPDNIIELSNLSVTSKHCSLELVGGKVVVKDPGSTNGTYLNDDSIRVRETTINDGDDLRLGTNVRFYVEYINILPATTAKSILDSDSSVSGESSSVSVYGTVPETPASNPKYLGNPAEPTNSPKRPPPLPPKLPPPLPKPWWSWLEKWKFW